MLEGCQTAQEFIKRLKYVVKIISEDIAKNEVELSDEEYDIDVATVISLCFAPDSETKLTELCPELDEDGVSACIAYLLKNRQNILDRTLTGVSVIPIVQQFRWRIDQIDEGEKELCFEIKTDDAEIMYLSCTEENAKNISEKMNGFVEQIEKL
ncbi:hypothetical protein PCE1_001019 [Barthelona sp. PCE]